MSKEKQILQLYAQNQSRRRISDMLSVSRNTVSTVITAAEKQGIDLQTVSQLNEQMLYQKLFPEKSALPLQVMPDFDRIHKELLRSGVTLRLLWEEYTDACHEIKQPPYKYSQYCKLYSDYVDQHRLTMHIHHKPGDKCMVDWAGTKLTVYDRDSSDSYNCESQGEFSL